MARRPPIIGLAGGIASGKSAVASLLAELGCAVFDADRAAREVLLLPEVRAQIVSWWGESVLGESGEIDRRAVAAIVFDDPEARRRLEGLTHPLIEARRLAAVAAVPREAPGDRHRCAAPLRGRARPGVRRGHLRRRPAGPPARPCAEHARLGRAGVRPARRISASA
jgi:hypothetical protein